MAGPGTFFGAPLMAGTTQFPTTNPSTGAVTPSNAGTAELTQLVSVGFGSLTASLAVPPGSIITNVLAVTTTTATGMTTGTITLAQGGTNLSVVTYSSAPSAGNNTIGVQTAPAVNPATITNPGSLTVTLAASGLTAGQMSVLVQYMPTANANDSNF